MKGGKLILVLSLSLLLILTACIPTPTAPSGKITEPTNNAQVERIISVSGTSQNISTDTKIWLVVYIGGSVNRYFPQSNSAVLLSDGRWTSQAVIGNEDDHNLQAQVFLVAANPGTQNAIQAFLDNWNNNKDYSGLEKIPESAVTLDMVHVTRK